MKQLLLFLFCLMVLFKAESQKKSQPNLDPIDNVKMKRQIDSSMKELDSINLRINDSYKHTMDSINNHLEQARNERNLEMFMDMQKEQQAKQKKQMWVRLVLGVLFFVILVVGLRRRKKNTTTS